MPQTDTKLRAIKPTGKTQKLSDGEGMYLDEHLRVAPTGGSSTALTARRSVFHLASIQTCP